MRREFDARISALEAKLGVPTAVAPKAALATAPAQPASAASANAMVANEPEYNAPIVAPADGKSFEVYGFAQLDYIQDFNRVDPNWQATLRPSKIRTIDGLYGSDGNSILSVRQLRFGVKGAFPAGGHEIKTQFEFDLYGTGVDAGQTTFRLRHAWGS